MLCEIFVIFFFFCLESLDGICFLFLKVLCFLLNFCFLYVFEGWILDDDLVLGIGFILDCSVFWLVWVLGLDLVLLEFGLDLEMLFFDEFLMCLGWIFGFVFCVFNIDIFNWKLILLEYFFILEYIFCLKLENILLYYVI